MQTETVIELFNESAERGLLCALMQNPDALGEITIEREELEAANPGLHRWFARAKTLQVGDEFSYIGSDEQESWLKLVWDRAGFDFHRCRADRSGPLGVCGRSLLGGRALVRGALVASGQTSCRDCERVRSASSAGASMQRGFA